ncbi:hypothetical protein ACFB49_25390 [Sphingomonas sp. DBB INV C78]
MRLIGLGAVGSDFDIGADRKRAELAFEAFAVARDITDCGHCSSPWNCARTVPGDGRTCGTGKHGLRTARPERQRRTGADGLI